MKKFFLLLLLAAGASAGAQTRDYPFTPVSFTRVRLTDSFWLPRLKINHTVIIPASFDRCEKTGRVRNFEMAASRTGKFCTIYPFDDTDIYKTIEGASFSLSLFPDQKLRLYMDSLIAIVGKAQEPDGYLYTARTIDPLHPHEWSGLQRWEKEREMSHELYNAGHLYEAAAAHYAATGQRNLLDIALKNADLVCSVFGPDKLHVAPGHEVVEMGLVKLYRITGKSAYLQTARFFIYERGHNKGYDSTSPDPFKNGAYWQDQIPVTDQREAVGHSVRAGYLYSAVADIAAITGDQQLLQAIDSIWENMVSKKLYVQGGAGAIPSGERYGENYELPNATAYNETCAAIANVFWNQRMFQLHGQSKYIDVLEKILYNGLISGVSLDGKSFFYTNAMQVKGKAGGSSMEPERSGWFDCSCCPTNLVRLLPSVPGYVYAQKDRELFVNLFISSSASFRIGGEDLGVEQQNNYPWEGDLKFILSPRRRNFPFTLKLRIPGWASGQALPSDLYSFEAAASPPPSLLVNGKEQPLQMENGYAVINRNWSKNDVVELRLPMPVRRVSAHPKLKDDLGRTALQRGPLVYCAEWPDNQGQVSNLFLPAAARFTPEFIPSLLGGVVVLKTQGNAVVVSGEEVRTVSQPMVFIPYYSWANRGRGEMLVWVPERVTGIDLITR